MTLAIIYSRASSGISAPLVTVEAHLSQGMPGLSIVGLPEAAVKESKDRVRSALLNSGFEFPARRMTINLAPADLPKEGGRFDLPIALGILLASGQLPLTRAKESEFTGELALSGELRGVHGILPMVIEAKKAGRNLIIPLSNALEAGVVNEAKILTASHLLEVCAYLKGEHELEMCQRFSFAPLQTDCDLSDVKGQWHAKRALEIAAAGKHNVLFMGPPGTGKTMLASRLPTIMPLLTEEKALEVAAIFSVSSNGFNPAHWQHVPFRSPHHSSSSIALVGGGRPPKPGEISLAHQGILFLDELPEFARGVLEALREPLESGKMTISRASFQTVYPAEFQLVAAMNPCPCGYAGSQSGKTCCCTEEQVKRYMTKLSGPLLDRIDLQIEVPSLPFSILTEQDQRVEEKSAVIKERVLVAKAHQFKRQNKYNAHLSVPELCTVCELEEASHQLMSQVMQKYHFSARVYHRILKLARTIADLSGAEKVVAEHLSEALTYRCLDRTRLNYYLK